MVIPLETARNKMLWLQSRSASDLFDALAKSGGYLYKKHVDKAKAFEAAQIDHQTKGYFKLKETKEVIGLAGYRQLTPREKKHVSVRLPKKPQGKHFGADKNVTTTQTNAIGETGFSNLLSLLINRALTSGEFYRAGDNLDSRFLCIVPIPDPYVGRSIDEAGIKAKDLTHAVIIIVADGAENPFVLNMFPCDGLYIERRTKLV